jgi:LytS/YehU family sensor histidine kinase
MKIIDERRLLIIILFILSMTAVPVLAKGWGQESTVVVSPIFSLVALLGLAVEDPSAGMQWKIAAQTGTRRGSPLIEVAIGIGLAAAGFITTEVGQLMINETWASAKKHREE